MYRDWRTFNMQPSNGVLGVQVSQLHKPYRLLHDADEK